MSSEFYSLERDELHIGFEGAERTDPNILKHREMFRYREGDVKDVAAESHCATEITVSNPVVDETRSAVEIFEKAVGGDVEIAVGDESVMNHATASLQSFHACLDLTGEPDVVLVGEEDILAAGVGEGVVEIGVDAMAGSGILDQAYAGVAETSDDFGCGI